VYLKRLGVPVLDLLYRGHVVEAVGQVLELLDAVGQANGQLLGEELRGAEQGAWGGSARRGDAVNWGTRHAPVEGLSPNCTIWRKLTPVAGNLA